MPEHRWSGWPGAWCLDCGCEDPREIALADGIEGYIPEDMMQCQEPMSRRHDPYAAAQQSEQQEDKK